MNDHAMQFGFQWAAEGKHMALQVIIDNEYATLWLHTDTNIIHHQFKKFIHGAPFRDILEGGYALMLKHHCTKWLSDDSSNGAITSDDEKWSQGDWFPRMMKAGWKHWAVLPPTKIVGQMNIKRFADTYGKLGLNARIFTDHAEALKWLTGL